MKKRMTILTVLLIACLALCGAAPAETAEAPADADLMTRVCAAIEDEDELIVMIEDDLSDLMGIEPEDWTDFAYLASSNALLGREVIAVLAADEEAADRVEGLLQHYLESRMRETRNYLPDTYRLLSEAQVQRSGCLVVLVVGENAEAETRLLLTGE